VNFYRSGFEGQIAEDLFHRGVAFEYETETFSYLSTVRGGVCMACGSKKCGKSRQYTPDFVVPKNSGGKLYIEAKGRFPSTDRSKMRDVKRAHPDLDLRILFQKTSRPQMNKLQAWADKFGFPCAFGNTVPAEWLE
jgi:hypothetical protein